MQSHSNPPRDPVHAQPLDAWAHRRRPRNAKKEQEDEEPEVPEGDCPDRDAYRYK
jgi:hypothetical protein